MTAKGFSFHPSSVPGRPGSKLAVITEWRGTLEVMARTTHCPLPADLQQAGQGEMAPAVSVEQLTETFGVS